METPKDPRPIYPPDWDHVEKIREALSVAIMDNFISQYLNITRSSEEDVLSDFLTDLMHWAQRNDYDFELAALRAVDNFNEEK